MQLRIKENRTNPAPFHDGMHEDKVRLNFDCGNCGHEFDENLLSSLHKGKRGRRQFKLPLANLLYFNDLRNE
jgi:hypothetical protein